MKMPDQILAMLITCPRYELGRGGCGYRQIHTRRGARAGQAGRAGTPGFCRAAQGPTMDEVDFGGGAIWPRLHDPRNGVIGFVGACTCYPYRVTGVALQF